MVMKKNKLKSAFLGLIRKNNSTMKKDFELPPIKKPDVLGNQSFLDRANSNGNYTFESNEKRE